MCLIIFLLIMAGIGIYFFGVVKVAAALIILLVFFGIFVLWVDSL